jgi:hypothetical protein
MATTTNYGWTTPDDTDLVKDGASAIRSLGSSVDTTVKALNPETTLGDLAYRSATANTNTRLPIGTNGQVLTVAGGVPSWSTAGAAGAYTSLATGTLSGASVAISSISQSYTDLYLVLRDVNLNTDNSISYRLNNDTTANFHISITISARIGGGAATVSNSTTSIEGTYWYPDSGDANNSFCLRVNDYTTSLKKTGIAQASYKTDNGNEGVIFNAWGYSGTSAVDRIDILTGSTFDGGTYILYGVK